jgi:hypothetical protein
MPPRPPVAVQISRHPRTYVQDLGGLTSLAPTLSNTQSVALIEPRDPREKSHEDVAARGRET